ncbi:MAG TPA: MarR family transcriptional regulator [Casimicrobiaceae bacterium]|nr:MarR family transcriptional regulator [Casimicrobiaceae bacterium]
MDTLNEPKAASATIPEPESVFRTVTRVRIEFIEAVDRELAPFDITSAQFFILKLLMRGEVDSASGLCRGISYDPGAMTRMLDRLEQKKLIRRVQHPEDRRKTSLAVTAEGKAVYPKLYDAALTVVNRFLRGFTKGEVRELESYLLRILANI